MRDLCIIILIVVLLSGCCDEHSSVNENSFDKNVEKVVYQTPYQKSPKRIDAIDLAINQLPYKYTYDDLVNDLRILQSEYANILSVVELGETADNRKLYDIVVKGHEASKDILIIGSMHAREYITTEVVMKQLCDVIDVKNGYISETYKGVNKKDLLEKANIHFVPMSNPDGVSISQLGIGGLQTEHQKEFVKSIAGDYEQWKANSRGVDLNRNFDADWYEFRGANQPASERYKGTFPGCEPESAALIELTQKYNFRRTISYHTCGALIYWYFKQTGSVLDESSRFAKTVSLETGYPVDSDYTAVDSAGYKDWAVYKQGIPSLTIEVGGENGIIKNPVNISNFDEIWKRNKNVIFATLYTL